MLSVAAVDLDLSVGDLLEGLPDAVTVVDSDGAIVAANARAAAITGYSLPQLCRLHVEDLVPSQARVRHQQHRQGYLEASPTARPMRRGLELRLVRHDGREVPVDVSLSPLRSGCSALVVVVIRDVSELHRAWDRVEASLSVTQAILDPAATGEILGLIAANARRLVCGHIAVVASRHAAGSGIEILAADGVGAEQVRGRVFATEETFIGRALAGGEARLLDERDMQSLETPLSRRLGPGPTMMLPLPAEANHPTVLVITRAAGDPEFKDGDVSHLRIFTGVAAIAQERVRLQQSTEAHHLVEDRERVARRIQNEITRSLFDVGLSLQSAATITIEPIAAERLARAVEALDAIIARVRGVIFDLPPSSGTGTSEGSQTPAPTSVAIKRVACAAWAADRGDVPTG